MLTHVRSFSITTGTRASHASGDASRSAWNMCECRMSTCRLASMRVKLDADIHHHQFQSDRNRIDIIRRIGVEQFDEAQQRRKHRPKTIRSPDR